MWLQFIFLFFLILLSGLFSASEVALISLTPAKVKALVTKKIRFAKYIQKVKQHPNRLLVTILVGNNIVNIGASVYATVLFTALFGGQGIGIAMGAMTFLILIFGEITPKSFAYRHNVGFAQVLSPILYVLEYVLYPIIRPLEGLIHLLMKSKKGKNDQAQITEDELKAMLSIGEQEGAIEAQEKELIENVLEFNDIAVREVMTPRAEINALPAETTIREAAHFITEHPHSRIPIYKDDLDKIIGILSVKKIIEHTAHGELDKTMPEIELIPIIKVPVSRKINSLFREFQRKKSHMAVVVDEHNDLVGVVTIEDLLEEIVGEIIDEHDVEEELIKKIAPRTLLVKGKTPIFEINETLKMTFDAPDYKPLSYLILEHLSRFPKKGESFCLQKVKFTIEEMDSHKIELVKLEK